ncbi:hypothetical protein GCM10010363_09230 [Streptomyces omiyaensis]|nr:hypothetical protein GCM10010363_09230 [Streptomyces omiyaensis]
MRPGRSPRARPTGAPQSEREQNRFRSGTSGAAITAARGSGRGTSGIVTSPAPSRLRADCAVDEPELRTDTERPVACPDSARESRPETERREDEEREEAREEAREPLRADAESGPQAAASDGAPKPAPVPVPLRFPGTATPVGLAWRCPLGATTGASPHVSQYSSPPPTSSYAPSHVGRWQPGPL